METAKERALAWAREDNERRSRAQSELERDEQELAELEILFAAARLQRPSKSAQENVADTYGWETVRRKIFRCEGGPNKSTMAGYVNYGDDKTYLCNFRMTRVQLEHASDKIAKAGFLKDSMHSAHSLRLSWRFKFATCCYVLAFWGSAGNYFNFAADVAGLGQTTVETWMYEFTKGKCWAPTICTTCHLQHGTYRRAEMLSQRGEGSPASPKLLTAHTFHSIQSPAPTSICTKITDGGSVCMLSPM
jgi:hypothetical protein